MVILSKASFCKHFHLKHLEAKVYILRVAYVCFLGMKPAAIVLLSPALPAELQEYKSVNPGQVFRT